MNAVHVLSIQSSTYESCTSGDHQRSATPVKLLIIRQCTLFNVASLWAPFMHQITSNTFLGCLSCISVTKECYQIDFLESSFKELFQFHQIVSLIFQNTYLFSEDLFGQIPFQKTYLATFLSFLPQLCNQGALQGQMYKIKETTNLTTNAELQAF